MVSGNRRAGAFLFLGFAALAAALGTSGCSGSDGGSGGGYCATWTEKLRSCGALGEGRTSCADYHDEAETCETACVRSASCADLVLAFCGTSNENAMYICMAQCIGEDPVDCGDGTKLAGYVRCDGTRNCENGADESGCTETGMKCRNVAEYIPPEKRCDGTKDCSDGSDEYVPDCATPIVCEINGVKNELTQYSACNGLKECDDASDEPADCAQRMCSSATN